MSRFDYNMEAIKAKLTTAMPQELPEGQILFTVKEAAPYFDLHEKTLRQKIRNGEIRAKQVSKRKTYIHREEIFRWWTEKP